MKEGEERDFKAKFIIQSLVARVTNRAVVAGEACTHTYIHILTLSLTHTYTY